MDYYFLVITIIDIFVLGILCVFTKYNEALKLQQRYWIIVSFALIIAISVFELVSTIVDSTSTSFIWVNIITNYLGFGLTPAVSICLSLTLREKGISRTIIAAQLAYMVLLGLSIPSELIFYVDENNRYMRGEFFGIYIFIYFISVIYLLVSTVRAVSIYQSKSKNFIYLIAVFLLLCTMIQIIFPHVHVSWACVSLLAILYATYCNIFWQQLDSLTGLLNQSSFLNRTLSLDHETVLIIFDIDDFKWINDTYGHTVGDECLKEVAACIKKAYSDDGLCYRYGGDEFCVLLDTDADKEACDRALINELEARRKKYSILPYISFGSAVFSAGDDIKRVKDLADSNMYQMKKQHKTRTINNPEGENR